MLKSRKQSKRNDITRKVNGITRKVNLIQSTHAYTYEMMLAMVHTSMLMWAKKSRGTEGRKSVFGHVWYMDDL